jgi:CubicO group peptidase (beta-lactamase class C family)
MKNSLVVLLSFFFLSSQAQIKSLSGKTIASESIDRFLRHQMDSLKIMGLSIAVINNGKIVYHQALGTANIYTQGKVNDETIFECASMGKSVFAYFIMQLVDKKVLSLDTPLYKYLPYPDAAYDNRYKQITARMVLCHTTGFPNWRDNDTLKILFDPGTKFSYSGEGYEYLAKVVAKLTDRNIRNLDSLFLEDVANPLHLTHTRYTITPYIARHLAAGHVGDTVVYEPSDKYSFRPAGGLYSEPVEFAKVLIAIMDNRLLTKESEDEMLKEQVRLDTFKTTRIPTGITAWGLGFSIQPTPYGTNYLHGGNNWGYTGQFMFNRDKRFGFVVLANTDQVNALKQNVEDFLIRGE